MSALSKFGILIGGLIVVMSFSRVAADDQSGPEIVRIDYSQGDSPKIVNGIQTYGYPATGELLYRNARTTFGSYCTATLIGCSTVLTAAHCVANHGDPQDYKVYFQHAGIFDVKERPAYQADFKKPDSNGSFEDVAILKLTQPVEGIAPQPINDSREHVAEIKGTIVGFGLTRGSDDADYGLKRFGFVVAAACPAPLQAKDLVCWEILDDRTSNICDGDSGGPLLVWENRPSEDISGVASGGSRTCSAPDTAFDASVFRNRVWIKSMAGSDLGHDACGLVTPLTNIESNDAGKRYQGFSGQLGDLHPTHVFEVQIKGAHQLRVNVNLGKPKGADSDQLITLPLLYIMREKDTDTDHAVCSTKSSNTEAQAASCNIPNPNAETYTVVLARGSTTKIADFQIVISVF